MMSEMERNGKMAKRGETVAQVAVLVISVAMLAFAIFLAVTQAS
jgi:hypothetical protein